MILPSFSRILLQVLFLLATSVAVAQGTTCNSAEPFCTGTGEVFANTSGAGNAQSGPNYGCLFSQPNPSWFYMQVGNPGSINLTIAQTSNGGAGLDVDFICWGPFSTLTGVCNQLTSGNIEDCSYSIASVETVNIFNAQVGDYYVVLITNYSNSSGTIDFQQTSGSGEADCDVLNPCNVDAGEDQTICVGASTQIGGSPSATGGDDSFVYSWSPISGLDDPTSSNPIASSASTTTYTLTVDDEAGCVMTEDVTVTVIPIPIADAGLDAEIDCDNPSVFLDGSASSSGTYTWSTMDGNFIQTLDNAIVIADQPGTYVLEVDAGAGCISTDEVIVTAGDLTVEAILSGPSILCGDELGDFNITIDQSADWDITFSIDGVIQSVESISGSQFDFTSDIEGTYEIISITNGICSADPVAPIQVIVEAIPSVTFPSSDIALCSGDSEVVDILLIGDGPLTFDYGIDMVSQGSSVEFQGPFSFNTSSAGTYAPISIISTNCVGTVSGSFEVEILLSPTASLPFDYDICDGEIAQVAVEFTGSAPYEFEYTLNGVAQGTIISNNDSFNFNVSESATIQIISLEDQECTGLADAASSVVLHPDPTATISGDGTFCSGSVIVLPVSLTGTGPYEFTYTLNGAAQPALNSSDPSFDLSVNEEGDYEIISISDAWCSGGTQNSSNVSFYEPIDIDLEYESDICASEPVIIEALVSGGQSGTYIFQWVDLDGTPYSGNPIEVIPTEDITIDLIVNDDCDLPSSDQVSINVQPSPVVDCGPATTLDCLDSTPILDGSASDSGTFLWTTSDGNILSDPTLEIITVDSPGTYQLEVTSALGCTGVSSVSVASGSIASTATLSGPELLCGSEVGDFSLIFDQSAVWTIILSIDGIEQPPAGIVGTQLDFSSNQPGVYEVLSASYGDCDAEILNELVVSFEETPSVTFPSDDMFLCAGESSIIEVLVEGSGPLTFEFEMNGSDQGLINTTAGTYLLEIGEEGLYTPISVNSENCVGQVIGGFDMNLAAIPSADLINENYIICQGENADVAIDFSGSSPFEFIYAIDGEIQDALTSLNGTYYLPVTTSGSIELINVVDANCIGEVSGLSEVIVNELPSASISGGEVICQDESIVLPITLVGEGPFEIQYEINGVSQSTITTSELSFELEAIVPGTYTVTSITDAFCSDGEQNATTVQNFPPIEVELDYSSAICENDSVTIAATASGGMSEGYSFLWSDLNENAYITNPLTLVLDETSEFSIIVNDDCDQPSIQTFDIEVQSYPIPSFLSTKDSLCIGEASEFLRDSQDASTQCIWTFDDGVILSGCDGVTHAFDSPGYHWLSLTATTSAGCSGIILQDSVIYVAPDPMAEFIVHPVEGTIFIPEIQFENISEDAILFDWEFGDGQLGDEHSPLHSYPGAIADYYNACLTAYNILGCIDTVCHFLEIESEYLMSAPNAFTPDDDGVNDFFIPIFNDIVLAEYSLKIFNRLGEIVFESSDQFEPWNGAGKNGSDFYGMDAVYYYRVVTREHNRSEKREHFGEVILIR